MAAYEIREIALATWDIKAAISGAENARAEKAYCEMFLWLEAAGRAMRTISFCWGKLQKEAEEVSKRGISKEDRESIEKKVAKLRGYSVEFSVLVGKKTDAMVYGKSKEFDDEFELKNGKIIDGIVSSLDFLEDLEKEVDKLDYLIYGY